MGRSPAARARRSSALSLRAQTLNEMTPALKAVCQELQAGLTEKIEDNLRFYHKIGKQCLDVKQNPEKYLTPQQRTQGVDPITLIEQVIGSSRSTVLRATTFAEKYDAEDLRRLFHYRNNDDPKFRLHWGHVGNLLTVHDARKRIKFEEQAVINMWDPDELAKHIQAAFGGPRRSGGRPLGIPRSVPAQINQMITMSSLWLRRKREVWAGPKTNVFKNIIELDPEKLTPAMLKDLQKLHAQWQSMREELDSAEKIVKDVIAQVTTSLDNPAPEVAAPAAPTTPAATIPTATPPRKSPAARAREIAGNRRRTAAAK